MSSTPSRTRDGDVSPGGNVPGSATGSPARRWGALAVLMPVSYTHLKLPTIRLV